MSRKLRLEMLETRLAPAVDLSGPEQMLLELLNRARLDPVGEALRYNVDLNAGLPPGTIVAGPLMPLVPNQALLNAARFHATDMLNRGYFSNVSPEGVTPADRVNATGYPALAVGQAIAAGTTFVDDFTLNVEAFHRQMFQTPEFRALMLSSRFNEIGPATASAVGNIGFTTAFRAVDVTELFGARDVPFSVTGVAFRDVDANNFFSVGEGLSGLAVTATNVATGQVFGDFTGPAGGYALQLPTGTYTLSIRGVSGFVTINNLNEKVDLRTDSNGGSPRLIGPGLDAGGNGGSSQDRPGVFRNGAWILDINGSYSFDNSDAVFFFGQAGDTPITGDWNGDGRTKVGVFRNFGGVGQFVLDTNGSRAYDVGDEVFLFGVANDRVVIGDWNGDGRDKVGVFRNGIFSLDTNGNRGFDGGDDVFNFGLGSDAIVIGDWNGDGRDKAGVFRNDGRGAAIWSVDTNGNRGFDGGDSVFTFGLASDTVVIGDWNANTRDKAGVVRVDSAGSLIWSLDFNGNLVFDPVDSVFTYGQFGDRAVVGKW